MTAEEYGVRLYALDNGFTKGLNDALDLLKRVEPTGAKAERAIDKLDSVLAKTAASGNATTSRYETIAAALRTVDKSGALTASQLKEVRDAIQAAYNTTGNLAVNKELQRTTIEAKRAEEAVKRIQGMMGKPTTLSALSQEAAYKTYEPNIKAAEASAKAAKEQERAIGSLSNARYILYDVAATWTAVSAATLGSSVAAVKVAADYEYAASSVQRTSQTTGQAWNDLYADIIDISTRLPASFEDIAGIATLGGQLGIAKDNIADFTETVTRFSAVTDVTTEAAAEGLGRVAQLTGTASSEYENLSSAIYEVGVNSVATESAILSTATQISTAANLAGFANHEVVALAGAFASLGIAPERSRGTMQRVFGSIEASVSAGGEAVEKFAQVSGVSAQEFASTWKSAPQQAFNLFVQGLADAQRVGADTNAMLKGLGIEAVRDIQALQALSNNMEVYTRAQEDAARAYVDGDSTIGAYAITAETLTAKLQVLTNNFKALMASVGDSAPVKAFVDVLNLVLKNINDFASTKVGGVISAVVLSIAAGIGVLAAFRAGLALAQAATIGLFEAQRFLSSGMAQVDLSGKKLVTTLFQLGVGKKNATAFTEAYTASLTRNTAAVNGNAVAATRMNRTVATGAGALNVAKSGMAGASIAAKGLARSLGPVALLFAAFEGIGWIWDEISSKMESTESRVERYSNSMSDLGEAMKADTQVYNETGEAIRTIDVEVEKNSKSVKDWAQPLADAAGAQTVLADNAYTATKNVKELTVAIGENTKKALANSLANNDDFLNKWQGASGALSGTSFDLSAYFAAVMKGSDATVAYIQKVRNEFLASEEAKLAGLAGAVEETKALVLKAKTELDLAAPGSDEKERANAAYQAAVQAAEKAKADHAVLQAQIESTKNAIDVMSREGEVLNGVLEKQAAQTQVVSAVTKALGEDSEEAGDGLGNMGDKSQEATDKLKGMADALYQAIGGAADVNKALINLGESLVDNGLDFNVDTSEGIANLEALQATVTALAEQSGGDSAVFAANIGGLMVQLQNMGVDLAGDASYLGEVFAQVFGEQYNVNVDPTAAINNIFSVIDAAIEAKKQLLALEMKADASTVFPVMGRGLSISPDTKKMEQLASEIDALENLKKGLKETQKESNSLSNAYKARTAAQDKNTASQKKNTKATKEAKEEFRTLADYASEVASVLSRAYELRFGVQEAKANLKDAFAALKETFKLKPLEIDFSFSKSFADSFSLVNARDAITSQFLDMKEAAEDAAKAVRDAQQSIMDANAKLGSLETERAKLLRQISVSEMYGDSARVAEGRARLAELDAQIAGARNDLKDAQDNLRDAEQNASKVTTGDSKGAIKNRKQLQSLAETYVDYIDLLMETGASQDEINKAIENSTTEFTKQAKALGFLPADIASYTSAFSTMGTSYDTARKKAEKTTKAVGDSDAAFRDVVKSVQDTATAMLNSGVPASKVRAWLDKQARKLENDATKWGASKEEVKKYSGAIRDMEKIVGAIPANISKSVTFKANTSAAEQALKEFTQKKNYEARIKARAQVDSKSNAALNNWRKQQQNKPLNIKVRPQFNDSEVKKAGRALSLVSSIARVTDNYQRALKSGADNRAKQYLNQLNGLQAKLKSGNYASGGFTGRGGKFEEAGIVHRGEYVIPKEGVDQARGIPKPEYLSSLFVPQQGMAQPAAPVSSGSNAPRIQPVELVPSQLAQLAAMISTEVNIDGKKLTRVVNSNNRNSSVRGGSY